MEAGIDLLGDLHDLLLLQGLGNLDQFRSIASQDGLVDITGIREAHDDIPAHLLGKHLISAGLIHPFCQHQGIALVGHPQQQAVLIALQSPHLQIACGGHERTIVVIHGVAQGVIVGIDLSAGLQEFHLIGEAALSEHSDGLFRRGFRATERHVGIDDLLHTGADTFHIGISEGFA